MAYQTGIINYKGSFKSIRNYTNTGDPKIYAGEKGGANRDLIMNNPAFERTRENMNEFKGCGIAVKAIRRGLIQLLPEHADKLFIGRLEKLIKMINCKDEAGVKGKRAISISLHKSMLRSINLHEKKKIDFELKRHTTTSHSESRAEATITVNGLNPGPHLVPGNAQYYRVINHLSIISDYVYDEENRRYKPLSPLEATSAIAYSDYTPVNTPLSGTLKAAFKDGTVLTDSNTVLQCVGVEFYICSGVDGYIPYSKGCMLVYDVF